MVKNKPAIFLFLFALITSAGTRAQQRLFTNQQHFGVEEGLPQSYISGIAQDDDGFLWVSTLDGLCRYDGRKFVTIPYNPKDSNSPALNVINNIERLQNNRISLFYSPAQVDDFDLRTFIASRNKVQNKLNSIPNARWQTYRLGLTTPNRFFMMKKGSGMGWLNIKTGKHYYANSANGLLRPDTICAIIESTEGKVFVITENGVQVSDSTHSKFQFVSFRTNLKKETADDIAIPFSEGYSMVCLPGNRIAVATLEKMVLLDIDKKNSTEIRPPDYDLSKPFTSTSNLQVDSRGRLYFMHAGRIYRLKENGELNLLWENTIDTTLRISASFIDRSDVLWVSVNAKGLLKVDLQASVFESYAYRVGFAADILEHAGVRRGAIPKAQTITEASYTFRHADNRGQLFFTSDWANGDKIYQLQNQKLSWFPHYPTESFYTAIVTMPDNSIRGFDQSSYTWYVWKTPSSIPEKMPLDKENVKGIEITDASFIGGYTWLSTDAHGLLQFNGTRMINRFAGKMSKGLMPETLTEICPDPNNKNKFWIGSRAGGLILWNVQSGLERIFTIADGLPNNTIYCILPDETGKIWCSTNKGIFRFDIKTRQVTSFEKTDGLPGNEFNRAHKLKLPDGRLAFGGLDGYTIFDPSDFDKLEKPEESVLMFTGLQINNKVQNMNGTGSLLKEPLNTLSRIELPYNKNYLRFEFAAVVFNQPQKTKYRYQLAGSDKGWIDNGTNNIASYNALPPGNYTLRINATNNNGLWSASIKELSIVIHPPFWNTWWSYLIYFLIAAILIRWYFSFREKNIKTEQSLAFEKREAMRLREVDEVKDRFFSNITHEFRTPLTLIISPLEKLMQDSSLPTPVIETIKMAQRNSKQLLRLINEFLDFSKLNVGQMKVKLSAGELALFAKDCVQSFEAAAAEKNIKLSFFSDGVEGHYLFDQEKWIKIISNLLSNALKFTPSSGEVSVSIDAAHDNKVSLRVKDNGPGIPPAQQQKIFERFYQAGDSAVRNFGGTGIGLSLVKELTELMNGNVTLETNNKNQTIFAVNIPVQKVQLQENSPAGNLIKIQTPAENREVRDLPLLLVVEDNDELRAFLIESMQTRYRVIEAADGLIAWDLILQELPDIIISDVMMPGQDGFDLCSLCKTDNRTAHIGFILLTSKTAHDSRLKGLTSCADDYITKPFNLDELQLRATNLLMLQQRTREHLQSLVLPVKPQIKLPEVRNEFLSELYKVIEESLEDAQLGVDFLCQAMGMSRSTLNRKLKSLLDISPNDLIRRYRLQKAITYLAAGIDISGTAYKVGFSSPSYFSQCFKEQYGITPSEWILQRN